MRNEISLAFAVRPDSFEFEEAPFILPLWTTSSITFPVVRS